jgi:uncharacterized membrane protein YfcA
MLLSDPLMLALIAGSYMLGSVVKGVTGFGALLIAVPIMSMVVEPAIAVALTSGSVVVSNIWQLIESRHAVWAVKRFWNLLLFLLPATLVGSQFLAQVDPRLSGAVIGVMVLLFCIIQMFPFQLTIAEHRERVFNPVVGGAAGLVGGATILTGSVLIMYLVALRLKKDQFIGTIALMYLCNSIPVYMTLSYFGHYTTDELIVSAGLIGPALIGLSLGRIVRKRVSQALFQRIVVALLFVIGVSLLLKAV